MCTSFRSLKKLILSSFSTSSFNKNLQVFTNVSAEKKLHWPDKIMKEALWERILIKKKRTMIKKMKMGLLPCTERILQENIIRQVLCWNHQCHLIKGRPRNRQSWEMEIEMKRRKIKGKILVRTSLDRIAWKDITAELWRQTTWSSN